MSNAKKIKTGLIFEPLSADPASPQEGMVQFSDGTAQAKGLLQYKDGAWTSIGGGSGGLDIFLAEDFESTKATDFTTGLNATFLTAGTFGGTLADLESGQLSGGRSIKYTAGATSTNDWIASPTIDLDPKQVANDCGITLYYTWDGTADIEVVVWDVTNGAKLNDSLDVVDTQSNSTRYSSTFYPPATCTQIKYGFHMVNAPTNGDILIFDDLELSTNPFVSKNLIEKSYVMVHTGNGLGSTNTKIRRFATTVENIGSDITYTDSAADGASFTINKSGYYSVSYSDQYSSAGSEAFGITLNSSQLTTDVHFITTADRLAITVANGTAGGDYSHTSWSGWLDTGDIIRAHSQGKVLSASTRCHFTIAGVSETEHIVTPAKSNLSDWVEYSPTIGGMSSPTGFELRYREVGDIVEFQGSFLSGGVSGALFTLPLPNGYTSNTASIGEVVGEIYRGISHDRQCVLFASASSSTELNMAQINSGDALVAINSNVMYGNGDEVLINARVRVNELSNESTFLAAVPVQKVAFLKDLQTSATAGGTSSSNTVHTRTLNTIEGDSSFVTISSNQFTLGAGQYIIEGKCPGFKTGQQQAFIYNTTDSTYDIDGESSYTSPGDSTEYTALVSGVLTITSSKTYELRHWVDTGLATNGLGVFSDTHSSNPQSQEVFSVVKITKLK